MKEGKKTHRIFFLFLFGVCLLAMVPPFLYVSNTQDIVLGLPKFLTWVFGWGFIASMLLLIMYYFDNKSEESN